MVLNYSSQWPVNWLSQQQCLAPTFLFLRARGIIKFPPYCCQSVCRLWGNHPTGLLPARVLSQLGNRDNWLADRGPGTQGAWPWNSLQGEEWIDHRVLSQPAPHASPGRVEERDHTSAFGIFFQLSSTRKKKKCVIQCPAPVPSQQEGGAGKEALMFRRNPFLKKTGRGTSGFSLFCFCFLCFSGAYQGWTNIHTAVGQWCFLWWPVLLSFLCPPSYGTLALHLRWHS